MATVENTTVKIYKSVPLMKGGTEVLYLSQAAAESALASYLYATYTKYYYTRENRGSIQIDEEIENLEGANYISFVNASHGSKIYFGFIDRLVYINDKVTQVEFTVDPFPTYLGDTTERYPVYVVRNSPRAAIAASNANYAPDYVPPTVNYRFGNIDTKNFNCKYGVCYFVAPTVQGAPLKDINGNATGIQVGALTSAAINAILADNGVIIGAYMLPDALYSSLDFTLSKDLGTMTGNPFSLSTMGDITNARYGKIKTGVYNKIVLRTSQGTREYNLEDFMMPLSGNITFGIVGLIAPSPSIFIYPKNYRGMADNLDEGVMMNCPAVPIATNATYTNLQRLNDTDAIIGAILSGAGMGALQAGAAGAVVGGAMGAATTLLSVAKNKKNTVMQPPNVGSMGTPVISTNGALSANLQIISPDVDDITAIQNYFDFYGYNVEHEQIYVIDEDGAYLQTGSEFLFGSEADVELNTRLNAGIKIRKTL